MFFKILILVSNLAIAIAAFCWTRCVAARTGRSGVAGEAASKYSSTCPVHTVLSNTERSELTWTRSPVTRQSL